MVNHIICFIFVFLALGWFEIYFIIHTFLFLGFRKVVKINIFSRKYDFSYVIYASPIQQVLIDFFW